LSEQTTKKKQTTTKQKMNKSNFKLLVIGAMATAMLASCNKNNGTEGNAPENGFRATIEQPAGNGSRTHIDPDWANDASTDIMWTAQDLIKVANGQGTALNYQITEGENTANGTFYTGEEHDDFFVPNYAAIYPAFNADDVANTISSTTATFNMPQTQTTAPTRLPRRACPWWPTRRTRPWPSRTCLAASASPWWATA